MFDDVTGKHTEPVVFRTRAAPPEPPAPPKLCNRGKAFINLKWNVSVTQRFQVCMYMYVCIVVAGIQKISANQCFYLTEDIE